MESRGREIGRTTNFFIFFFKMTRPSKDTNPEFLKNRMRDYRARSRDAQWGEEGKLCDNLTTSLTFPNNDTVTIAVMKPKLSVMNPQML
jgi:hypothetical protein